ncbi:MAG: hypothetical protein ACREN8_11915 [Candidatus Dormibacteraceae bacterium]
MATLQPGVDIRITMPVAKVIAFRVSHIAGVPYQSLPTGLFVTDGLSRLTVITLWWELRE